MIHRCVQGKSLDCHKHHGFWVCSSGLVAARKDVAGLASNSRLPAKRGWQKRWETRKEWPENSARIL
jgi:hypothetical protein